MSCNESCNSNVGQQRNPFYSNCTELPVSTYHEFRDVADPNPCTVCDSVVCAAKILKKKNFTKNAQTRTVPCHHERPVNE
ncbi:hypothetical protein NECAME_10722 [Necator americanus]|uniref:Uncharacterized protein n=1 Tax=Necator americanus TaxID=51031 RepID=W2T9N0_NECAM|nr:hypothetical protein NECAME_10722 [Necator americanus]ETN77906.1 hypothetical protein NECAME_10722 [Necator americanus]